jgi:DNA primase
LNFVPQARPAVDYNARTMADVDLSRDVVDRVREAADIVEVVGDHVRLKRRGRTYEGLCPFHEEKTPSFSVDPAKGLYYCFGCHQGGDIFKFIMQAERLAFPEAVERLARRYGVKLPPRSPEAQRRQQQADRIRSLLEEAQSFFVSQLNEAHAGGARRELERRGFDQAGWSDFGFGWAPDDWRTLSDHLGRRHPEGALLSAGLTVRPDSGKSPYDRFRNRITFPIRAADGRLVAFGGRILGDGEPKYLNSPESQVFQKRSTLFCLDRASRPATDTGVLLVVEGYFDCLSLHRVGIANVVATLGTALTLEHARVLRRRLGHEGRVVLCYDADAAGRRAAITGTRVLLEAGVDVAILALPAGTDPDDIVREGGAEPFRKLLARPQPILDFLLADLPQNPDDRRRKGMEFATLVCAAADAAVRQNLVEELARRLYLRPREIEERGRPRQMGAPSKRVVGRESAPPGERHLARILIEGSGKWRARIVDLVRAELITDDRVRRLLEAAAEMVDDESPTGEAVDELLRRCSDEGVSRFVAELCNSHWPELTDQSIKVQLRTIAEQQSRELAKRLAPMIRSAEERGDHAELDRLLAEKARLRQNSAKI